MGALAQIVRQGKALYVGVSSYGPERTRKAAEILRAEGIPLFIHQPSYSILNRWIEDKLLETLHELGTGCIAFSALAQGLLTNKYLHGIPENSRASSEGSFSKDLLSEKNLAQIRALNSLAQERGQTLAQMAIAWVLRDARVTTALIGARNVEQLDDSLDALKNTHSLKRSSRQSTNMLWTVRLISGEGFRCSRPEISTDFYLSYL